MNTLLHEIGAALYGEQWRTPLGRNLSVNERTIRRWAAGTDALPPGALREMRTICLERAARLVRLAAQIEWLTPPTPPAIPRTQPASAAPHPLPEPE